MEKFGGATNFAILLHIVEGINDGICKVNTFGQIEANQRDAPILCHVHVPLSSFTLSFYSNPSKNITTSCVVNMVSCELLLPNPTSSFHPKSK